MGQPALHVLLIHSEADRRDNVQQFLCRYYFYSVDTAGDADQAWNLIAQARRPYQVVLIENALPPSAGQAAQQVGIDLMRRIRARNPQTEFIAFTNKSLEEIEEAEQAGAFRCLGSDFNMTELAILVRHAADSQILKSATRERHALQILIKTGAALLGGHSRSEALRIILKGIKDTGFDRVRLCLLSEDRNFLVGESQVGVDEPFEGLRWPIENDEYFNIISVDHRPHLFARAEDSPGPLGDLRDDLGIAEWSCVPVLQDDAVVGGILTDNKASGRPIIEGELGSLALFAAQVAAVIESRPLAEIERRARNLKAVLDVTAVISSSLDLNQTLSSVCKSAVELIGVEHSGLALFSDDRAIGKVCAEYPDIGAGGLVIPLKGVHPEEQLSEHGEPLVIEDVESCEFLGPVREILVNLGIRSILIVPVISNGQAIGSFSLDAIGHTRVFSDEEIEECGLFAAQVARAVENARLFGDKQAQLERLELVSKTITEITSDLDAKNLEARLDLIARRAAEVLDAEVCGVFLVKQEGLLSLEASWGHREGGFKKGKLFEIRSGPRSGLTGHIAWVGNLFNERGEALANHEAVAGDEPDCSPSGQCHSLLAIPLKKRTDQGETLVGLLRASNKKGPDGLASSIFKFTEVDEWVLKIFAEAVAAAIESGRLVDELKVQKESLRVERDRVARLWASSPLGLIAIDEEGKITAFNEQAELMMGYRSEDVKGKHVDDYYSAPAEARRIGKLLHTIDVHTFHNERSAVKSISGEVIPVRLSATWLFDGDQQKRIGSVGYFEDLRKSEEAGKRQDLLLEASNIIAKAATIHAGLESLAKMVVSLLDNTFSRILLMDESKKLLEPMAAYLNEKACGGVSWDPHLSEPVRIDRWQGFDTLLVRGKPFVLRWDDERVRANLDMFTAELNLNRPIRSLLLIPLKIGDRLIGLLDVAEMRSGQEFEFGKEKIELAGTIASQAAVFIDHRRQLGLAERRKELLTALDEALQHILTEKESTRLQQEITRLGAEMFDCDMAGLLINRPNLKELEFCGVHHLPLALIGQRLTYNGGLLSAVAQSAQVREGNSYSDSSDCEEILRGFDIRNIAIAPFKRAGEVLYVLFIADSNGKRRFAEADIEMLQRFAARCAVALETSRLMSKEQQVFDRLTIVHKISQYLQEKQHGEVIDRILHVVLTGVTAQYGLGFNRAVLFMRESESGDLVGRMGIGQFAEEEARAAWVADQKQGLWDFDDYLKRLEKDGLPETAVGERIKELRIPVRSRETDAFSEAVLSREWLHIKPRNLNRLPKALKDLLAPQTDVAIVPLVAREQVIGVLAVDNKFTMAPMTPSDIEALLAFASTVAIAVDNIQLNEENETARKKLRALYTASNELISAKDPHVVLQDIVSQTLEASGARYVRLILVDEKGRAYNLVTAGPAPYTEADGSVRPDGIALRVLDDNRPEIINDKRKHTCSINPRFMEDDSMAALCLPLSLHERKIGVLWIHFDEPRHFPDFEVDALQLYANQAAIAYEGARQIEELDHMRTAAQALAGVGGSQEVLEQIVRSAREVLRADSAAIWSYDPVRNVFIPDSSVADGISTLDWEELWKTEPRQGGTAYTVMEKEYVAVEDVSDGAKYSYLGQTTRTLLNRIGAKSFKGIALKVGDKEEDRLGVLYVNYNRHREFSEEERETAETFANHAAAALNKARLREQLEKARNAARVVAEVTALENLPETLTLITSKTRDAVHSDAVTLYTYDAERDRFKSPPAMDGVENEVPLSEEILRDSAVYQVLALDDLHVAEDSATDPLMHSAFVEREGIASSVGVPLIARERKVGVMFVNYRRHHRFTEDELTNIRLFANQAAVAIRNAELYTEADERAGALEALYEAAMVVTASLDSEQILIRIAKQAYQLASYRGTEVKFVHIRMLEGSKAKLAAAYPESEYTKKRDAGSLEIDVVNGVDGRIGIMGRAIKTGEPQVVGDVTKDPDYIKCNSATRSELVVFLKRGSEIVGLVNVEHSDVNAFDAEDRRVLESLAAQASIAIQNADQYQELNRTKTNLAASMAVAWMGMASAAWGHNISGHAITISEEANLLNEDLTLSQRVSHRPRIEKIKRLAALIQEKLIKQTPSDNDSNPLPISSWVQERQDELWERETYNEVECEVVLPEDSRLAVLISPDWLRQAFDILVDNAVKFAKRSSRKKITIAVSELGPAAEIAVTDSGDGIPQEVLAQLFQVPIHKPDGHQGMGLLIAQMIVQANGGKIYVASTQTEGDSTGTTMVIRLPLV